MLLTYAVTKLQLYNVKFLTFLKPILTNDMWLTPKSGNSPTVKTISKVQDNALAEIGAALIFVGITFNLMYNNKSSIEDNEKAQEIYQFLLEALNKST